MSQKIWITWEDHRRSRELAQALGVPLVVQESSFPKGISHIHKSIKFLSLILEVKPKVVFVQNPSIILAFVASLLKVFLGYKLVVDRHTNFRLGKEKGINPINYFYDFVGNFSLRKANLTIVTNSYLKKIVEAKGGKAFVLEDLIPKFSNLKKITLVGEINIIFICTYADDEPYQEVIGAANLLPSDIHIYITGRIPSKIETDSLPKNVTLTGFLSEIEYCNLLYSAQLIMDFTSLEWCLVCGGYEAISLEKPFLTSSTEALQSFFGNYAIYTDHNAKSLAASIKICIKQLALLETKMSLFKKEFHNKSQDNLFFLKQHLSQL